MRGWRAGWTLCAALAMLALASPAQALDVRRDETVVILPDETVDDDLLVVGGTLWIQGRVRGDLYALAQSIDVSGPVEGDAILLGQRVRLAGSVGGDARVAGDDVAISAPVTRNVLAAGSTLQLHGGARVGGSWTSLGGETVLWGPIGRSLWLSSLDAYLGGEVGGPGEVSADALVVGETARLRAPIVHWSAALPSVHTSAQVASIERREPRPSRELSRLRDLAWGAGRLLTIAWLASTLVAGALFGLAVPRAAGFAVAELRARPVRTAVLGLGALALPPIALLLLSLTGFGLPLALVVGGAWLLMLLLGWLLAAAAAAAAVSPRLPAWLGPVGGVALLWLVGQLPFVGGLSLLAALVLGVGLSLAGFARLRRID